MAADADSLKAIRFTYQSRLLDNILPASITFAATHKASLGNTAETINKSTILLNGSVSWNHKDVCNRILSVNKYVIDYNWCFALGAYLKTICMTACDFIS